MTMTTTYSTNNSGFRKMTPAMIASQNMARDGITVETSKPITSSLIKRVFPLFNLFSQVFWITDLLLRIAPAEEFELGCRPIVSISNGSIAEQACCSTRTVSRALKILSEVGLIAFKDSPSGKRFQNPRTKEAYGIDLTPMVNRRHEFEAMAQADKEARSKKKIAQRAVSSLKKQIFGLELALSNEEEVYQDILSQMSKVLATPGSYEDKAESLSMIYEYGCDLTAQTLAKTASEVLNMSPEGDMGGTHIHITNLKQLKRSSENMRGLANANHSNLPALEQVEDELAFEEVARSKAQASPLPSSQMPQSKLDKPSKAVQMAPVECKTRPATKARGKACVSDLSAISIGMIDSAAVETKDMLGDGFSCWADLVESTEQLRLAIGLSVDGWKQAVAALGQKMAAAVLVVTVEKTLRDPISITRPAGYFRACVDRAKDGKLMLNKSIFGLQQLG